MATPNKSVNRAFQKGLQLIYKEMFQYIHLRFMDEEKTVIDEVYDETYDKVYQPPIKLLGHYKRERYVSSEPVLKTNEREVFKIPVQEFYDHELGFKSEEEIETLRKAVIRFQQHTYKIDEVNPRSVVAGDFLIILIVASPAINYVADDYDRKIDKYEEITTNSSNSESDSINSNTDDSTDTGMTVIDVTISGGDSSVGT